MTAPSLQLEVCPADILSPAAAALIAALNAELDQLYPEAGANHFRLDADEVVEGRGMFCIAYVGQVPAGCGAIRRVDERTAEIKRMYVVPSFRGQGVASGLLVALETASRRLGCARLVLETGNRQTAAVGLYLAAGFSLIPPFDEYVDSPLSVCMGKELND